MGTYSGTTHVPATVEWKTRGTDESVIRISDWPRERDGA